MNESELKPCPFCGYPAVFEPFKERKGYAATIRCCRCPAEITTITLDTEEEAEMEAVETWNRRVNDDVPTIDVVERKRGKWVKLDNNSFHCQLCGHTFIVMQGESFMNYCPNCGADMRNVSDNGDENEKYN